MNENYTAVPNNQMAVISIVSAAVAWVLGGLGSCALTFVFPPVALCTGGLFLIGSIVAVVTGHMGRKQIKESSGMQGGDSLAMFGLILGWVGIAINLLILCLALMAIFGLTLMGPEIGNVFSDIVRELETTTP
ncbi:MAG: DUF4190 domain-containing protein [Ardenticatenaceae bacterium]|nr:DUF4190 domain-containing protein [Ardenticatenaceae bacterium]MCB9445544.1 DUF4190 domain-containing protein [Ardenticatenaceae bacterium]